MNNGFGMKEKSWTAWRTPAPDVHAETAAVQRNVEIRKLGQQLVLRDAFGPKDTSSSIVLQDRSENFRVSVRRKQSNVNFALILLAELNTTTAVPVEKVLSL